MQRTNAALLMALVSLAGCTSTAVTSSPEPNELVGVRKGLTNSTGRDFLAFWSATEEK